MVQEELVGFNLEGSVCQVLAEDRVGELLAGRYRVLRRLGAGGMGTVYLAEHVHLGRLTAVKVFCLPLCDDDPSAEHRFRQEALLVARVRHPSVAQVYDFDRGPDGQFLLAMEYVEGETVAQRLQRGGPFPLPDAMRALRIAADALNHVHWIGILHRDLKPQNIMLGSGGVVFYEMVTGRLPHAGTTVAELRIQRLLRPPIPVHWLRPTCPPALAEVVAQALHPDPAERWPSAVAFAQAAARAVASAS